MRASSRVLFPATVAIAAYGVGTREAKACHPVQMCATWTDVVMEDGPFGDLVTGTDYAARGARVRVIRPYPEPALEMYLDDEGCGSFDSQFTTGHKVLVFTEAVLGAGTNNQIHIKSYESEEAKEANVDSAFPADMPSMPEDWGLAVSGPADPEHRVEHLAIATEVLYRLQGLPETLLTGGHTLKIWVDPMAQNASAPIGEVRVGAAGDEQGLSALGKKFILAHEIGHWIQLELTGEFWSLDYGYGPIEPPPGETAIDPQADGDPIDAACRWGVETLIDTGQTNPNRHGIRSAEFSDAAMPEGFGHFVAAVAFNSNLGEDADGEFRYYKQPGLSAYDDFIADNLVVSLLGGTGASGGDDRWVELQCSNDFAFPEQAASLAEEVTSEIDWLRFFWRFMTETYSPQAEAPTFWDVVLLVTYTQSFNAWSNTDHVVWPKMLQTFDEVLVDYQQRFENLTVDYGIHNDGT